MAVIASVAAECNYASVTMRFVHPLYAYQSRVIQIRRSVEKGTSMSTAPCKTLQPSADANGIRTVYPTFFLSNSKMAKKA